MTDIINTMTIGNLSEVHPLLDNQIDSMVFGKRKVEDGEPQVAKREIDEMSNTNKRIRIENEQEQHQPADHEQQEQEEQEEQQQETTGGDDVQFNGDYYVRFGDDEFKGYQMVLRTTKGDALKTLFQANSADMLEKAVFRFEPAGFILIGMDSQGGYLVHSKINASAIENYYCPVIFHMKLHLAKLAYRLGLLESKSGQVLTLKARNGVLDISIESGTNEDQPNGGTNKVTKKNQVIVPSETAATFTLTELDQQYDLPLPEAQLVRSINVDLAWFAKAIKNLENIDTSGSNRIKFTITCCSLSLSVDKDGVSEGQIMCRQAADSLPTTTNGTQDDKDDTSNAYCYNLKWLNICIKVFKLLKTPLNLTFGDQGQLFFSQDLAGDMGSNRILIAPLTSVE